MKELVITNTSNKRNWDTVTVTIPEHIQEVIDKYGIEKANNGYMRFMLHSLPIKARQCKDKTKVQEYVNKLLLEPVNSRITGSEKSRLYNDLADFGFERKELKGLTVEGLEKLLKALKKVPITSPPKE